MRIQIIALTFLLPVAQSAIGDSTDLIFSCDLESDAWWQEWEEGQYGLNWLWERDGFAGLENNRWYSVEQYAKLNTPGENDGILRGWVDGKLVFEKTDVRMRDIEAIKIETVWLNLYYGGTWTAKADYHVYIDDVAISRSYIGPVKRTP